jgi:hypothetical protein
VKIGDAILDIKAVLPVKDESCPRGLDRTDIANGIGVHMPGLHVRAFFDRHLKETRHWCFLLFETAPRNDFAIWMVEISQKKGRTHAVPD